MLVFYTGLAKGQSTPFVANKRQRIQRIPKGQLKMNNPEKLATQSTQDEEKQNKNTTQYELNTTMRKQTQHNMSWTPQCGNKHNTI